MPVPFFCRISVIRFLFDRKFRRIVNEVCSGRVLELGAGPLSYKHLFVGCDVVSTDIEECSGIDEVADVRDLRYKDGSFDCVVCVSVLEHVFEIEKAISEIYRVLRKGGVAIINTPFLYPLHDEPGDYYRFTEFAYRRLLKDFSRVEIDVTTLLPVGIVMCHLEFSLTRK